MGISTFGSFTQARLAIYASQGGLTVTGNNIANINTEGYTRQRLDQSSFYAGSSDRYSSMLDLRIGNGVLATGVSQLRDPYLDIRYRNEVSEVGYADTSLSVLEQIESILDEVGDGDEGFGVIADQINDLYNMLSQLNDQTGHDEYDILVRTSAQTLVNLLNSYSSRLEEVYNNTVDSFNTDVKKVNTILTNIQSLNETIRKAEIHGDRALELRDERNLLLDELAGFINVDITYEYESIGAGVEVEKLIVAIADSGVGESATRLVDGIYVRQLEAIMVEQANPDYDPNDPNSPPYLDAKGNPVTDPADAKMVNNAGFDIGLTALADSKGRFLVTTEKENETITYTSIADLVEQLNDKYPLNPALAEDDVKSSPITVALNEYDTLVVTFSGDAGSAQAYVRTTSSPIEDLTETNDNILYGSLQALREMLTEEGEFASADDIAKDPDAATKRGIPYYQQALDMLAWQLADIFNTANQGYVYNQNGEYVTKDGEVIKDASGNAITKDMELTEDLKTYLDDNGGQYLGAVLFSNNGNGDDTTGINASNISISKTWAGTPSLVRSFEQYEDLEIGSTDSSNILHMIAMMNADLPYDPKMVGDGDSVSPSIFTGSLYEFWNNTGTVLGNQMNTTGTLLDTSYATSVELSQSRDSVSAVDLNDEAMNLTMYQQAYNAACRLMTTLDSVLDKLVNGTGLTT